MNCNTKQNTILILKKDKANWVTNKQQTQKIRNVTNLQIRELGDKYYIIKNIFDKFNIRRDTLFYFGKELESQYKNQKFGIHLQTQKRRIKDSLVCWYTQHFYTEIISPNSVIIKQLLLFNTKPINNINITKKKFHEQLKCTRKARILIEETSNQNIKLLNDYQFNQCTQPANSIIQNKHNDIFINQKIQTNNDQNSSQFILNSQISNQISNQSTKIDNIINKDTEENFHSISNTLISHQSNQNPDENLFHFQNVKVNEEIDVFENGNITNFSSHDNNPRNMFY